MAAFGARFESEKSISDKRDAKRTARERELQRAKDAYEKQEKLKEQKQLRGEDTWMLGDINERLDQLAQEHSGKKKKKKEKHSKKAKKDKHKSKKQKIELKEDSFDSSSDSQDEWIESTTVTQSHSTEKAWRIKEEQSDKEETTASVERDEWMTLDFMSMKTTSVASIRAEKQKEKEQEQERLHVIEQANILSKELNPYWKDGGTGLPPEEGDVTAAKKAVLVEDGGLSWLQKSYQRMKEQSESEKRSLDEIIAARYGSVEIFQAKMKEAEKQAALRYGGINEGRRASWKKSSYSDVGRSGAGRRGGQLDQMLKARDDKYSTTPMESPKQRYRDTSQEKDDGKHLHARVRSDVRESGKSNSGLEQRNYESRTLTVGSDPKRGHEGSSSGHKHKFMKPSEEEELPCKSKDKDIERQSISSLSHQSSLRKGFRKPVDTSDDDPPLRRGQAKDANSGVESHVKSQTPKQMMPIIERLPTHEHKPVTEGEQGGNTDQNDMALERKCLLSRHESDAEPIQVLSEEEMNKLGAKLVKAELMGNMDLASKLKTELENARKLRESQRQIPSSTSTKKKEAVGVKLEQDSEVLLLRTDQSGRAWPVNVAESLEPKGGRRRRLMAETHEGKERVRYFKDDDNQSLQDLVRKEKMGTAEDQNKLFMRMASKFMEKTDKEYYTLDDMFVSKTARKESSDKTEEHEREQAISEHRKLAARMDKCPYCFDNPELPKHLIVAIGKKVYVCLPNYLSLTDGHCIIAPLQHYHAATLLDEDIWEEIQLFRKALVRMFESNGLDCVFLETNLDMKKRYHMVYECIPLPKEVGDMAPIYFKKAIMESDEEWSMNKKLIDLSSRDVRKSVPKGLPYFSVDFGLQGGYAHVIEDQHKFPHYFGKEIIGGMLDLEPRVWRKAVRENFDDQRKKVLEFAQLWKPYDFTKTQN
ncbi:CWF19-like protein 2 [Ambystoma mexicanum]|uniref:CWF19-like protein 2 n=1 Tax=Ambystoma mexicanum TaxID=8296 RepID=UPI0037E936F0